MKQIAVVILNWNGQKLLEKFLPSVIRFSPEASIYVADNDSDDLSVELVRVNFPMVKVIRNIGNYGYAKGYNEALRHVEEDIYALVNSDVEVTQGWLEPIIETLSDEKIAIVQPKILDYNKRDYFEYAGAAGGFIDKFGYPYCRGRIFDTIERDNAQYDDADIFWASGACFFIRKSVFRELKGFDADFFAHMEEIDLCWRARNANHAVRYCGRSTVYHIGGATLQNGSPRKTYLNFRNSLIMLVKNLPQRMLLPVIFSRLVLDGLAGVRFLLKGQFEHIAAIVHAHGSFYAHFGTHYDKRTMFRRQKYYSVRSIAFQYFVKKRKYFTQLFNISLGHFDER